MTLVVLSVVVIGSLIAALAAYLLATGVLLNRVADNLDDCLQSVKTIGMQATPIGPGVVRLNKIGTDLANALPLLYEAAEGVLATKQGRTLATSPAAGDVPVGVGYLDLPEADRPEVRVPVQAVPASAPVGVGYLDAPEDVSVAVPAVTGPVGVGYLDV